MIGELTVVTVIAAKADRILFTVIVMIGEA